MVKDQHMRLNTGTCLAEDLQVERCFYLGAVRLYAELGRDIMWNLFEQVMESVNYRSTTYEEVFGLKSRRRISVPVYERIYKRKGQLEKNDVDVRTLYVLLRNCTELGLNISVPHMVDSYGTQAFYCEKIRAGRNALFDSMPQLKLNEFYEILDRMQEICEHVDRHLNTHFEMDLRRIEQETLDHVQVSAQENVLNWNVSEAFHQGLRTVAQLSSEVKQSSDDHLQLSWETRRTDFVRKREALEQQFDIIYNRVESLERNTHLQCLQGQSCLDRAIELVMAEFGSSVEEDAEDFLLCSTTDDYERVVSELLPTMERGHGSKVCFPDADFDGNLRDFDQLYDAALRTKKIVVLLSEKYLQDIYRVEVDLNSLILPLVYEGELSEKSLVFLKTGRFPLPPSLLRFANRTIDISNWYMCSG